MTTPTTASDELAVAVVVGAHGIQGALRMHLYAPDSAALRPGLTVALRRDAAEAPVLCTQLISAEPIPGRPLVRVRLATIHDRNAAEALRGCSVWLQRSDLPPLASDEFYLADVIGLPVERVRPDGRVQALGVVVALTSNGAQDLLEVGFTDPRGRRDTWLLPVLPQFIAEVDAHRLRVDLPLGLLPEALADGDDDGDVVENI